MRKILLCTLMTALLLPAVLSAYTVKDSATGGSSNNVPLHYNNGYNKTGYHWTAGSSYDVSIVSLNLKKYSTPTGTLRVQIYATAAGVAPTGAALASSDYIAISGISTSGSWHNFTFNTTTNVTSGGKYAFVLDADNMIYSPTLYVRDVSAASAGFNQYRMSEAGAWSQDTADQQINYYTYAFTPEPINEYNISVIDQFNNMGIASATVNVCGKSNTTDSAGNTTIYNCTGVAAQEVNVTYANYWQNASALVAANGTALINMTTATYRWLNVTNIVTNQSVFNYTDPTTYWGFFLNVGGANINYGQNGTYFSQLYLRSGQMNITMHYTALPTWYNITYSENITAYTNNTLNMPGAYNSLVNITAVNTSGSAVTNFTIAFFNSSWPYYDGETTTNGSTDHKAFYNGTGWYYNVSITASGYDAQTAYLLVNNKLENYTFTLSPTTSINISGTATSNVTSYTQHQNSVITIAMNYSQNSNIYLHDYYSFESTTTKPDIGVNNFTDMNGSLVAGRYGYGVSLTAKNWLLLPQRNLVLNNAAADYISHGISIWFKPNGTSPATQRLYSKRRESSLTYNPANPSVTCYFNNYTADLTVYLLGYFNKTSAEMTGTWAHTYCDCNNITGEMRLFINGSLTNSTTLTGSNKCYMYNNLPYVGASHNTDTTFNGTFDEFKIFNRLLNTSEVYMLYNDTGSVQFGAHTDASWLSCNTSTGTYTNTTLAQTSATIACTPTGELPGNTSEVTPYAIGTRDIQVRANATSKNITWDTVTPVISVYTPNISNTSVYTTLSEIPFNLSMQDTYLYGYNTTCTNSSDGVVYSIQDITLTPTLQNNVTYKQLTTPGVYNCTTTVVDSHTAKEFNPSVTVDREFIIGKKYISINNDDIIVSYTEPDGLTVQDVKFVKDVDRVRPVFIFAENSISKNIYFDWQIKYRGKAHKVNSKYNGHVVILPNGDLTGGYWTDADDETKKEVQTQVKNGVIEYKTKMTPQNYKKTYKTDSIGGLNSANTSYSFTVGTAYVVNISVGNYWNGTAVSSFSVNMTNSTDNWLNTTTSGYLRYVYGVGAYTFNVTPSDYFGVNMDVLNGNWTGNKSVNLTQAHLLVYVFDNSTGVAANNINVTVNGSGTTYSTMVNTSIVINVSNGTFTVTGRAGNTYIEHVNISSFELETVSLWMLFNDSVNLTFYDEETNLAVNNVSYELISTHNNFSNTTDNDNTAEVNQIYREFLTIRYSMDNSSLNGSTYPQRYYFVNLSYTGSLNITLYLINNSNAQETTAKVYDNINRYVEGVYIEAQRYDITTNSYKIVSMAKTGVNGDAVLYLTPLDEYYKFILRYPFANLRQETNPDIIKSTAISFQLTPETSYGKNYGYVKNMGYNLTFNNATKNFRLTYSDPSAEVSTVHLDIYRVTSTGSELINSTTSTSTSATLLAGITPQNGSIYIARAYADFGSETIPLEDTQQVYEVSNPITQYGLILMVFLNIAFIGVGAYSIFVALVLFGISNILGVVFGLVPMALLPYYIGFLVICFIVGIIIHKLTE